MLARDAADRAQLAGRNHAVGDANAHHEPVRRQPLAALAAGSAHAVALGVDAPPFEVGRGPVRRHALPSLARKAAHLVKGLPGILFVLQALHALGFGLFLRNLAHCLPLFVVRAQNGSKKMPASAFAVSRALLGSRTRFLDSDRGCLCHANSVHTAATTDLNAHEMNIDRNGPDLQVLFVDFQLNQALLPHFPARSAEKDGTGFSMS